MHSALLVADYLIAHSQGSLTPLHVIKLAYFSHGYTLAIRDKPLVIDRIEAWPYGPVIPNLYYYVRMFDDAPVTTLPYCRTSIFDDKGMKDRIDFLKKAIGKEADIMGKVLDAFGDLTASELIRLTHTEGSPWDQCYEKGKRKVIPTKVTKEYYRDLIS